LSGAIFDFELQPAEAAPGEAGRAQGPGRVRFGARRRCRPALGIPRARPIVHLRFRNLQFPRNLPLHRELSPAADRGGYMDLDLD